MKKITVFALHLGVGGIEKYTSTLCGILENDYKVNIICTYRVSDKPVFDFSDKIKISYLIDGKPDDVSIKKLVKKFKIIKIVKEFFRRVKNHYFERTLNIKAIRTLKSDYVITTRLFHSELVSKYLNHNKIKSVMTDHNYHQNNIKYINRIIKAADKFEKFVVCTKDLFDSYASKLPNTESIYMPNSLDNISDKKTTFEYKNVIAAGRFSPEKGFLDMIEVFKYVHDQDKEIKLFLLGDGFQKQAIIKKVYDLGLQNVIVLPGFVTGSNQEDYYLKSSLYLMTSFTEAFGLVLIEAMNYGIPCIAFDSASGPKELITNDIGVLISSRDKKKMASEIVKLINDKNVLLEYQKSINSYINIFSPEAALKNWKKVID